VSEPDLREVVSGQSDVAQENRKAGTNKFLVFLSAQEKGEAVFTAGRTALSRRDTTDSAETGSRGRHCSKEEEGWAKARLKGFERRRRGKGR
jgi:hypothetical protein